MSYVMTRPNLVVIDYGMSNIFSVKNSLAALGFNATITSIGEDVIAADGAILPGVGAFPQSMQNLRSLGLDDAIREFVRSGKPLMGICLGLQLLFSRSFEFETSQGLNLISGDVISLANIGSEKPVPHVGWNTVHRRVNEAVLPARGVCPALVDGLFFYFVHSYVVRPEKPEDVLTTTRYGEAEFCSSVSHENILGCQFHPEKSGPGGLSLFQSFFD
jgi:imidazole glycerol-phosphate synthase subunit HisH